MQRGDRGSVLATLLFTDIVGSTRWPTNWETGGGGSYWRAITRSSGAS